MRSFGWALVGMFMATGVAQASDAFYLLREKRSGFVPPHLVFSEDCAVDSNYTRVRFNDHRHSGRKTHRTEFNDTIRNRRHLGQAVQMAANGALREFTIPMDAPTTVYKVVYRGEEGREILLYSDVGPRGLSNESPAAEELIELMDQNCDARE